MATWIDCASSDARKLAFLIDALGGRTHRGRFRLLRRVGPALNKAGVSSLVDPERFKRFTDKNSRANPP